MRARILISLCIVTTGGKSTQKTAIEIETGKLSEGEAEIMVPYSESEFFTDNEVFRAIQLGKALIKI